MTAQQRSERRRTRGTPVDVVSGRKKLERPAAGLFGRHAAPSTEAVRKYVEAGVCPWCGKGPWKMLAGHVAKAHGVDRFELRELAGLLRGASVCDPAYSEERSALAVTRGAKPPRRKKGQQQAMSTAGLESQRANSRSNMAKVIAMNADRTPEERSQIARKGAAQRIKPRSACVICGEPVPYRSGRTQQKTCSKACERTLRSRSAATARKRGTTARQAEAARANGRRHMGSGASE